MTRSISMIRMMLKRARTFKANQQAAALAAALGDDGIEERQRKASEYCDRVIDNPNMCIYGHPNCADSPAGKCSDEVMSNANPRL